MTAEETAELYIRIVFQYESALDQLVSKGLIDKDLADRHRGTFYNSLDEEKLRTSQKNRSHENVSTHLLDIKSF